jgi:hypothetical protein
VLRYHEVVYDGIVIPGVTTTTGIQHANALGLGDQMGLQAVVDRGAGGTFTAAIEHSGDGIHWTQKNPAPEIDAALLLVGQPTSLYGGEPYPPGQSLEHVRIRLEVTPPQTSRRKAVTPTWVRLHAVLRERGKGHYSTCGCDGEAPHEEEAHARAVREERARRLEASRPHASMAALERQLLRLPMGLEPRERTRRALGMLGGREQREAMEFILRVVAAGRAVPG